MERLRPGLVLSDRYRLVRHVASGGMGQVWEAGDTTLERRVALTIMHPSTDDEVNRAERFRDEARFAARLSHPHIVTVFDFIEYEGLAYLVMEFVDGATLANLLTRGPLGGSEVRRLVGQLASALRVAHDAGIIHRDIKPANVLVVGDRAQLTDFGIARSVDDDARTLTGQILGTAHYLSPEQALGQRVGPATDIYSLGVLAHEMLTASKPFARSTPIATALAHVQDPPPPLPIGTPGDLAAVITASLAKNPDERPSAALIVEVLGLRAMTPTSTTPRTRSRASRGAPCSATSPSTSLFPRGTGSATARPTLQIVTAALQDYGQTLDNWYCRD